MQQLLEFILKQVKQIDKNAIAESVIVQDHASSINVRNQKIEEIERSNSCALGLRVIIDQKQAFASVSNLSNNSLEELANKVVSLAKLSPVDPLITVASKEQYATSFTDFNQFDEYVPDDELLISKSLQCESVARDHNLITNSDGASCSYAKSESAFMTSKGFFGQTKNSDFSLSASVIAGEGQNMETDYDYSRAVHFQDLKSPDLVGKKAQARTLAKLNAKQIKSCKLPVIFDKRVARSLISLLASAVNGIAVVKESTFLINDFEKQIFPENVNIIDNPHILKGASSTSFDSEGLATKEKHIIHNGVLNNWFLDLRTAKQLNLKSNASAERGIASAPHPSASNFYIENGNISLEDMIKDLKKGILITETFGMGINIINGTYSQGAFGYYIENGEIIYPVNGITIASNLKSMYKSLLVANDMEFNAYSINSPSLLIEQMTIAGK